VLIGTPVKCQLWSLSILSWSDRGSILDVRALQPQGHHVVIVAEAAHSHLLLKINSLLKVPLGQILSVWEWYHWIGLEKDINRYRFFYFLFWSWIFDTSSKFWAASCKNESNLLLVGITVCMCSNRDLFRRTMLQICRRDINCSLDYGSWVKNSNIPQSKPKYSSK
jgi:hypothetical protein